MTQEEACKILGVSPGTDAKQIKKKYRQLMHRLHPDSGSPEDALQLAQQINIAYALLKSAFLGSPSLKVGMESADAFHHKSDNRSAWNAPISEHAYREREVLCCAESPEGEIIGTFTIARGKYFWTIDEDFPLFLRSIYNCGKELLDEIEASLGRSSPSLCRSRIHADLTYLLAQQYIDASSLLWKLAAKVTADREEQKIFYFPAMLETSVQEFSGALPADTPLFPAGVRNHRLYLKDGSGQKAGYLSFIDDRLYYVLVPLFEQRRVLVRIRTAGKKAVSQKKGSAGYRRLHLWLKIRKEEDSSRLPEGLNLQISQLLEKFKFYLTR